MHVIIEALSTTTGATTTAYRKHIFCSGHAQKLNNWLQSAVVKFTTPHSLFWRSADNVVVHCKVFSPFLWFIVLSLTTHKEVPFWCLLLKFFWEELLQWTSLRQENALAQAASRQIHRKPQARRNPLGKIYYIYIFYSLVFTDPVQYAVSEIRSFSNRTKSIFLDSKISFTLYRIHDFRVKLFFVVFIYI